MDIFSWKYLNERSQVLLWAMSLTKESEHLASHRLSAKTKTRLFYVKEYYFILLDFSHITLFYYNRNITQRV